MDRAFSSGALGTPPSAPASPSIGYPTSGNAGSGTPPTKPGAYWYHMVTEEIRGVLVAAGLTPDQGDVTQLLQALRAAGVFTTPPQFNASTKAATTAFVQAALGNDSGYLSVGTTSSLSAANAGKLHGISTGGITLTLPSVATVLPGAKFILQGMQGSGSAASTISRAGSDTIITDGSTALTTLSLSGGDTAVIEAVGAGLWSLVGGSAALRKANGDFGSNKVSNGYQKLPSGLIFQWGQFTNSGTANAQGTVTFPITYPNACLGVIATPYSNSAAYVGAFTFTTSTFLSYGNLALLQETWFSIGY